MDLGQSIYIMGSFNEELMRLAIILSFCIIGSYTKNTLLDREERIRLNIIILSSVVISILIWSMYEYIVQYTGEKMIFALSVILGMLSYEIVFRLSTLQGVKDVLKELRDFLNYRKNKH